MATRQLASVYCSAVDDGDPERVVSLFVPGGGLSVYGRGKDTPMARLCGVDDFRRLTDALARSYVRWVHFLGNHWVESDGETAEGETYLMACHLRDVDGTHVEEVAVLRYRDEYVRTADGWRFAERHARRQWTSGRPLGETRHAIDAAMGPPRPG